MNEAEHQLIEGLDYYGERPQLLQRLALVNMVKNNLGTARIYLGALSNMLFYSKWANEYLNEIDSDPALSMDKQVQSLRRMMMDQDHTKYKRVDELFLDLLNKDRYNRMAFEYLMASYMLVSDLDSFTDNIYRFNDFNYPQIPRLYEEAILLCSANPKLLSDSQGKKPKIDLFHSHHLVSTLIICMMSLNLFLRPMIVLQFMSYLETLDRGKPLYFLV